MEWDGGCDKGLPVCVTRQWQGKVVSRDCGGGVFVITIVRLSFSITHI